MYMDKTLREMLENPLISDIAPDAISKWDLSGEEFWNWTLQEIADKMGWSSLERGFMSPFRDRLHDAGSMQQLLRDPPARRRIPLLRHPASCPKVRTRKQALRRVIWIRVQLSLRPVSGSPM